MKDTISSVPHSGRSCQANLLNWYWEWCDGWLGINGKPTEFEKTTTCCSWAV